MGNCQSQKAAKTKNEEQHAEARKAAKQMDGKASKAEHQALADAKVGARDSKLANNERQMKSQLESETAKVKAKEAAAKDEQRGIVERKENAAANAEHKVIDAVAPAASTSAVAQPNVNDPPATAAAPATVAPPVV